MLGGGRCEDRRDRVQRDHGASRQDHPRGPHAPKRAANLRASNTFFMWDEVTSPDSRGRKIHAKIAVPRAAVTSCNCRAIVSCNCLPVPANPLYCTPIPNGRYISLTHQRYHTRSSSACHTCRAETARSSATALDGTQRAVLVLQTDGHEMMLPPSCRVVALRGHLAGPRRLGLGIRLGVLCDDRGRTQDPQFSGAGGKGQARLRL